MIVHYELSLENFEAWSGGKDTMDCLSHSDLETLEQHLTELYPNGMTDTELNDFLWFERDTIADLLGYRNVDAMFDGDSNSWEEHYNELLQEKFPFEDEDMIAEFVSDEVCDNTSDDDVIKDFKDWLKDREENEEEENIPDENDPIWDEYVGMKEEDKPWFMKNEKE